jgi:hypothetical protein
MKDDIGNPILTDFNVDESLDWQMSRAEKYCLMGLMKELNPDVSIEIGTYKGGSLQVISAYSQLVYSIDISDSPKQFLSPKFPNVEFVVGDSVHCLPKIFHQINEQGRRLDFILVDGDHTRKGVYRDLEAIFNYPHTHPITILMHDSFNPECRKGIRTFLESHPQFVTYAELDYVTGAYWHNGTYREMWGGLALVRYDPQNSSPELYINQSQRYLFESTYLHSAHLVKDRLAFLFPLKRKIFKSLGLKNKGDIYHDF